MKSKYSEHCASVTSSTFSLDNGNSDQTSKLFSIQAYASHHLKPLETLPNCTCIDHKGISSDNYDDRDHIDRKAEASVSEDFANKLEEIIKSQAFNLSEFYMKRKQEKASDAKHSNKKEFSSAALKKPKTLLVITEGTGQSADSHLDKFSCLASDYAHSTFPSSPHESLSDDSKSTTKNMTQQYFDSDLSFGKDDKEAILQRWKEADMRAAHKAAKREEVWEKLVERRRRLDVEEAPIEEIKNLEDKMDYVNQIKQVGKDISRRRFKKQIREAVQFYRKTGEWLVKDWITSGEQMMEWEMAKERTMADEECSQWEREMHSQTESNSSESIYESLNEKRNKIESKERKKRKKRKDEQYLRANVMDKHQKLDSTKNELNDSELVRSENRLLYNSEIQNNDLELQDGYGKFSNNILSNCIDFSMPELFADGSMLVRPTETEVKNIQSFSSPSLPFLYSDTSASTDRKEVHEHDSFLEDDKVKFSSSLTNLTSFADKENKILNSFDMNSQQSHQNISSFSDFQSHSQQINDIHHFSDNFPFSNFLYLDHPTPFPQAPSFISSDKFLSIGTSQLLSATKSSDFTQPNEKLFDENAQSDHFQVQKKDVEKRHISNECELDTESNSDLSIFSPPSTPPPESPSSLSLSSVSQLPLPSPQNQPEPSLPTDDYDPSVGLLPVPVPKDAPMPAPIPLSVLKRDPPITFLLPPLEVEPLLGPPPAITIPLPDRQNEIEGKSN
ncbi:uncharacterized protein MONOS_5565 [Monocercomonoides exilis]|uniref:uncharacterized protein n=1 Tax=Monocercomonoides exilis TaxID=2049356 RepID=UPI00355A603C|nr:hypothetical protein MONOS_5565 [Monocercomonoides exilis]|eukprot:MONOS_5565.1-p1 / transcript=MONOS_5565.1 / gene=MONOS_5565 / organism=Monocercomonoides_exilis_PA203 / gene_product=unspecified product / transcript_product=unspecified product / location=Mono_scaffold00163:81360-83552(-) / protein_length=731 / sequence_SO=supercontig / SO=protein_coding / is_pseudo=false